MPSKYKIIEGVKFAPYGERSLITNENLTDEIAEMFISKDKSLLGKVFELTKAEKKIEKKVVKNKKK